MCLRGAGVPVAEILERLAAGETFEALRRAYPELARAHVAAALRYAAQLAHAEDESPRDILAASRRALREWARANPW